MGCCSSTEDVEVFDMPRPLPNGSTNYPRRDAQNLVNAAPAPTHNKRDGRRPHAHYDSEGHYAAESIRLTPLPGVRVPAREPAPPVLWAYPGPFPGRANYPYAQQNTRGMVNGARPDPGPFRVITDRHQNVIGASAHPTTSNVNFVRAPEKTIKVRKR